MTEPRLIEQTGRGERDYDIFSRLLKERIVFVSGKVSNSVADKVVSQLLFLEAEGKERDVFMYINSPGGEVSAGLAIYDTMQYLKTDISTICFGQASSMAAVLLSSGAKGKRFALPSCRIMIHQPLGGSEGHASDIEIYANELLWAKKYLNGILVSNTGQSMGTIKRDTDRNFFLSAEEAKEYGLIDEVLVRKK